MKHAEVILALRRACADFPFTESLLQDEFLFVEEKTERNEPRRAARLFTEMTSSQPEARHFKIRNTVHGTTTAHICVDGDLIPYGQTKYNPESPSSSEGRPDSLVFNDQSFLFLELKVGQEDATETKEDPKWKRFFDGARQIEDFVNFLKAKNFDITSFYPSPLAVICFRFEPNFSIQTQGNTQRNSQLFKISTRLGFRLIAHNHNQVFEI